MLFQDSVYGYFLVVVCALFWMLRGHRRARHTMLLFASWFFYACWDWRFLSLIWLSTVLDFAVGRALAAAEAIDDDRSRMRRRRWLLTASLVGNLGVLAVFKYYGFFTENLETLLGVDVPALDLVLPVGISFYTFQTLSYTIDVYRGTLRPTDDLIEFALFVSFFPQLVAGPIVRAADFLPQLEHRPWLDTKRIKTGLGRIQLGLIKKVLIADTLALGLVDPLFARGPDASGLESLLAAYAFSMQLYCDFSGYSDIAIGSALLIGFRIPENFLSPYGAVSITDFWRRWHISLSSWLRDYLYIPLGGNRRGVAATYVNLMATMLLSGLWHGAAWNFPIWGGLHGLWLAVERFWSARGLPWIGGVFGRVVGWLCTFHFACLAFVVFRAEDLATAAGMLGAVFGLGDTAWLQLRAGTANAELLLVAALAAHLTPHPLRRAFAAAYGALPAFVHGILLALLLAWIAEVAVEETPFLYFQF